MNFLDGNVSYGVLVAGKATFVLALAFGSSFLLRRASASARHYLWALTFGFLLVIPAAAYVSFVQEEMRIPIAVLERPTGIAAPVPSSTLAPPAPTARESSSEAAAPSREPTPSSLGRGTNFAWSLSVVAGSLWLLGSVLLLVRLGFGIVTSRRIRIAALDVEEVAWVDLLDAAQRRLSVTGWVELKESDYCQLPMTLGLLRPAILLPEGASDYSVARRSAVLLHELAHVRRHDCWTQLLSQLVCSLFWWHPLVWLASRHMRLLSERASDDLVLDAGARPSDYAHDLLEMAKGLHEEPASPLASVTMAHRSRFEERLLAILDPGLARAAVSSRFAFATAFVAMPLVAVLGLAMPTASIATAPPLPILSGSAAQLEEAGAEVEEPSSPSKAPVAAETATEASAPELAEEPQVESSAETSSGRAAARAALVEALDDPEPSVREQALQALIQLKDASVTPYLVKALRDADGDTRAQAAWGLGQMRRAESANALAAALADPEEDVREQAAWALGMLRSESAVGSLVSVVQKDEDSSVREQAAWALGMIRSEASAGALAQALGDADASVREQAVWALGMIRSPSALDGLVRALSDDDEDIRSQAAWALGMLRDSRAVEPLSRALKDEDPEVREQAAWALGLIARGGDGEDDEPNPNPNPNPNVNPNPNPRSEAEAPRAGESAVDSEREGAHMPGKYLGQGAIL